MTNLSVLVKGDLIANSQQPRKDMLELLMRFTTISAWKLWEGDVQSQLHVLDFCIEHLKSKYPNVTMQMFEKAIIDKIGTAYERSALSLFMMLDDWLLDNSSALNAARESLIVKDAPLLAARTESQRQQDVLDLVDSIRQSVAKGEAILGGWDIVLQHFTDIGVHEKGSDVSVKIWNESIAKVKANLVNQQKTGQIHERSAANIILQNWEEQGKSMDVVIQAASIYTESICRYYFNQQK